MIAPADELDPEVSGPIAEAGRLDPEGAADVLTLLAAVLNIDEGLREDVVVLNTGVGVVVCVERVGGIGCVADATAVESGLARCRLLKNYPRDTKPTLTSLELGRLKVKSIGS
jgi:hypothetical protein